MRTFLASAPLLLAASGAHASCGLDMCPMPTSPPAPRTSLADHVRVTGAHQAQEQGWYVEEMAAVGWRHPSGFAAVATVPYVVLTTDETVSGLGDVVAAAEWRRPVGGWLTGGGIEVELPTATDPQLGGQHVLALPYFGANKSDGRVLVDLRAGFAHAFETGAGDEHDVVVFVNPHTDDEAALRAEVGPQWMRDHSEGSLALTADARIPLEEAPVVDLGAMATARRGRWLVDAHGELPVSVARRLDWRLGLGVMVELGKDPDPAGGLP